MHSEGVGKVLFSQVSVCPHLGGGWNVPHLVDRGVPPSFLTGVQLPPFSRWGVPHPSQWEGLPHPKSGWGNTPIPGQDVGVPPGQDGGYPIQSQDEGTTSQVRTVGYPHPRLGWGVPQGTPLSRSGPRSAQHVLVTQRVICLLRSRRGTFLCW